VCLCETCFTSGAHFGIIVTDKSTQLLVLGSQTQISRLGAPKLPLCLFMALKSLKIKWCLVKSERRCLYDTFSLVHSNCRWLEDDALENKSPRPCVTNFWRQETWSRELSTNAVRVCVQKTTLSGHFCYWNVASPVTINTSCILRRFHFKWVCSTYAYRCSTFLTPFDSW
jgi:hypothetical protein